MALTDSEKGEVTFYLGYSAKVLVPGTVDYSKRVAERFDGIPDHLLVRARKCLTRIRTTDTQLDAAATRFAVTEADGIKLNEKERDMILAERRRYILQLSNLLDLPLCKSSSGINVSIRL